MGAGIISDLAKALAINVPGLDPEKLQNQVMSNLSTTQGRENPIDAIRSISNVFVENPLPDVIKVTALVRSILLSHGQNSC